MSMADTFAQFMNGLKPAIHQQIALHVTTLAQAHTMATMVDLYTAHGGKVDAASSTGGNSGGVVEESP